MNVTLTGKFDRYKLFRELEAAFPLLRPTGPNQPAIVVTPGGTSVNVWLRDDVDMAALQAVITAHDGQPRERPKSRKERAKDALAAIDASKLTGENKKLLAVLAELVDD